MPNPSEPERESPPLVSGVWEVTDPVPQPLRCWQLGKRLPECEIVQQLRNERDRYRQSAEDYRRRLVAAKECYESLEKEHRELRVQNAGLAERVAAQAELLSRRAEREPDALEIVRAAEAVK